MEELVDLLDTIRRKTYIADILIKQGDHDLLPTILECLFEDAQKIIDDYCVVSVTPVPFIGADSNHRAD